MFSNTFSRAAIVLVLFLLFVLFILSGSPETVATTTVLFLTGAVMTIMLFAFCRQLARVRAPAVPSREHDG